MDNMLEMYLYETNTLMEQLDELLIEAEKNEAFTTNDVNEIFRIMHTIKGSSAMMEFSTLMEIAHHIEDLFFYIRENGMDSLDESHKSDLFNLMFQSTDALRVEVEKIENDEPLSTNIDQIITNINSFLEKISSSGNSSSDAQTEKADASSAAPVADAQAIAVINQELAGCPASNMPYFIRIHFEQGSGMENLHDHYCFERDRPPIRTLSGRCRDQFRDERGHHRPRLLYRAFLRRRCGESGSDH